MCIWVCQVALDELNIFGILFKLAAAIKITLKGILDIFAHRVNIRRLPLKPKGEPKQVQ